MTSSAPFVLPPLTADEEAHSQAVAAMIRERIASAGGWIPFDTFMDLALYAPGLGYYNAGGQKLGAGGDFVTAPELSDLFSRCVACQAGEILAHTGGSILELGAGTGRLAAVMLQTLAERDALPECYWILEVSADLRERQQRRIERLPSVLQERVAWLDRLPERPMHGVILANELLDALPCKRFALLGTDLFESGVCVDHDTFTEREAPADGQLQVEVEAIQASLPDPMVDGYQSELCARVSPWITGIAQCLDHGAMLLFDYGVPRAHYYHPQRRGGTLRCHFKQRAHSDPLINIGVQDITAWVDFTRVAEAADAAGLEVCGLTTQAAFLLGTDIGETMAGARDAHARARLSSEARQLMMPGEMGEIFKAMALTRRLDIALRGFAVQNLRHLL